jgi:hypothetical protein
LDETVVIHNAFSATNRGYDITVLGTRSTESVLRTAFIRRAVVITNTLTTTTRAGTSIPVATPATPAVDATTSLIVTAVR